MAGEILTAGTALEWAVETVKGTRPTTGFAKVPNCQSVPDFNVAPATHQVTDLSDLEYHRYIPGLKDIGGEMAFGFNFTSEMRDSWKALVAAFKTAQAEGMAMWFAITHIKDEEAFYFEGEPIQMGLPAHEVDTPRTADAYIVPNKIEGWAAKPV